MVRKTPKALELQIHRIHELLEGSGAAVTWDDHIPDPDNPSQLRQIDITVRRHGRLTVIECRLSKRRQDVKWTEELMGRRDSLAADTIIGVASAGFTAGARKKAARYGVLLRDLLQLTDQEVLAWSGQVAFTLYYYQYADVTVDIGFSACSVPNLDRKTLAQDLRAHNVLQSLFNAAAKYLETAKLITLKQPPPIRFGVVVLPEKEVLLSGEPVMEIRMQGTACLVARPVPSHLVYRYGEPAQSATDREITVQKFTLGETSITHHGSRIAIDIDLSGLELPPLSQVRFFRTSHEGELDYEIFAITNPAALVVTGGRLAVNLYVVPGRTKSAHL